MEWLAKWFRKRQPVPVVPTPAPPPVVQGPVPSVGDRVRHEGFHYRIVHQVNSVVVLRPEATAPWKEWVCRADALVQGIPAGYASLVFQEADRLRRELPTTMPVARRQWVTQWSHDQERDLVVRFAGDDAPFWHLPGRVLERHRLREMT